MEHRFLLFARKVAGDTRSDAELLALVPGDHGSFAECVGCVWFFVWGVCRRLLGEADAEDAFQATFFALFRSACRVRDGSALSGWLYGVAVRISFAARRESRRRRARERAAVVSETTQPHELEDGGETMAAIHREVAQLPALDRSAFVLCVLEGLTQTQAAVRLGRTPGVIAGQVTRSKKRLLRRLTERGVVPVLVGLGVGPAAAVPPDLLERAQLVIGPEVPSRVLRLAKGVSGMIGFSSKLLAAAILVGTVLASGFLLPARLPAAGEGGRVPREPLPVSKSPTADPPMKTAPQSLKGRWTLVSSRENFVGLGRDAGREVRTEYWNMDCTKEAKRGGEWAGIEVEGDKAALVFDGTREECRLQFPPSDPKAINFVLDGQTREAIYSLQGDTLVVALGDTRPKSFTTRGHLSHRVMVFVRENDEEKKDANTKPPR